MSAPAMTLAQLLAGIADAGDFASSPVAGLTLDSRGVRAGEVFVALQGTQQHGITFAPAALASGAAAILAEAPAPAATFIPGPVIWIAGLREHLGALAARYYGAPSQHVRVTGVTGTNGKTSTVQLLAQALAANGHRAATIGTLGAGLVGALREGERTTPDAINLQRLLAEFRAAGATHVAMEVSSHALEQGRVNGIDFNVAVYTNLTRDHLDYHGSMQAYAAAKARLFAWPSLRHAVINVDDAHGRELYSRMPRNVESLSCGIDAAADLRAIDLHADGSGTRFTLVTPWGAAKISTRLLGRFNVQNLLGVAGALGVQGVPFSGICSALAALDPVNGRMNRLGGDTTHPLVVVDYAHTPDALEQALSTLRAHCAGTLTCVFGCGGERDAGKRPQMGEIAERLADRAIVTDDNPRGEDGDAIVRQIVAGMSRPDRVTVQRDRAQAIRLALQAAHAGDIVLIAGKGHEPYQEVQGSKLPFDDLAVARRALEEASC